MQNGSQCNLWTYTVTAYILHSVVCKSLITYFKDRRSTANTKTCPSLVQARFSRRSRVFLGLLNFSGMFTSFVSEYWGREFDAQSFRKSCKFTFELWIFKISVTYYCTTALVKDTVVSIRGRSHTSANLDLEIEEESKNKDINVRNPNHYWYLYRLTFCDKSVNNDAQDDPKSSRQESSGPEQPSKKNVSASPMSQKIQSWRYISYHLNRKSSKL